MTYQRLLYNIYGASNISCIICTRVIEYQFQDITLFALGTLLIYFSLRMAREIFLFYVGCLYVLPVSKKLNTHRNYNPNGLSINEPIPSQRPVPHLRILSYCRWPWVSISTSVFPRFIWSLSTKNNNNRKEFFFNI